MSVRSTRHRVSQAAPLGLSRRLQTGKALLGSRPLRFEQLEAREMLTVGLTLGSLSPLLPLVPVPPTTGSTAGSAAPSLSPAQVAEETAIAQSINAFGLELYAALQSQAGGSGNTVFSPLSISAALAMAYAGANGETATQMASVLHFAGDSDAVEQEFGTLLSDLNSAGQGGNYTLSVADSLWGQQGMQILAPFLRTMQSDFDGGLKQVNFAGDPATALQTINTWVAQQTDGHIKQLLSSDEVTRLTQLVLTNAVYFNGNWATAFDPAATSEAGFTLDSGDRVLVSMMHNTSDYGYMDSDGFQVLDLPYAGGRLSMDIILPNQGYSAAGLNVGQFPADLTSWLSGLQSQQVAVSLPKFTINTQFELGGTLQALGMTDAFDDNADFSGITDASPLSINSVAHAATISVTETGTVATAATGVSLTPLLVVGTPGLITFDADHPFLFLIRDDQSGAVLFMGQEMDPTSTAGNPSAPPIVAAAQFGLSPLGVTTASSWSYAQTPPANPTANQEVTRSPSAPPGGLPAQHGQHQFVATDDAVSEFDLTDLYDPLAGPTA